MSNRTDSFIYGAAYYEEYLTEDRLERDMELISAAGLNTIRIAESTWSVEERLEGQFDFSHVIKTIEAAAAHGLKVIIGTPSYAVPTWLAKLDPGVLGGNAFGPRQNMDITNPTYRFYAERIIRKLASATAGYPNVIGFQIDNETKHYGTHSKQVLDGFREWLGKRFGSVDAVNKAFGLYHWSNSAATIENLPDPTGSVNAGYIGAFEEYRRELAAEFLQWQSDIVNKYKRDDQFITHNFDYDWHELSAPGQQMGYSAGLQPDLNLYEVSKSLDISGTDIYFEPEDNFTGMEIAFGGDLVRSLKKSPYLVMESQAQAFSGWLPYPGQLRQMVYSHIASGACGVSYWPWLSIHSGIESYWKGVISHDGEPGPDYSEIAETGHEIRAHEKELFPLSKRNRVAMIVSPESLHALRHFPTDQGLSYNDVVEIFYRALYELNIECDVLYDRDSTAWFDYDMIVFPQLYSADDGMISRVREYVSGGGTILASFRSFFADENLAIRNDRQPHGLNDVFGMHYSRYTKAADSCWIELLETDTAEAVVMHTGKYWKEYAAVTRNGFGKGHAWYVGKMMDKESLKKYVIRACSDAGIDISGITFPIICREAVNSAGDRLHFIFNYSSEAREVKMPVSGFDVLTGETLNEGNSCTINDWGVMIISESL